MNKLSISEYYLYSKRYIYLGFTIKIIFNLLYTKMQLLRSLAIFKRFSTAYPPNAKLSSL